MFYSGLWGGWDVDMGGGVTCLRHDFWESGLYSFGYRVSGKFQIWAKSGLLNILLKSLVFTVSLYSLFRVLV